MNWETVDEWEVENRRFALSAHRGADEPAGRGLLTASHSFNMCARRRQKMAQKCFTGQRGQLPRPR